MEREVEPVRAGSSRHHIEVGQALTTTTLVFILGMCLFLVVGMVASLKGPYPNIFVDLCMRASIGAMLCLWIVAGVIGIFNAFFKPEVLGERHLLRIPPAARRHLRLFGIAELWASAWIIALLVPFIITDPFARALPSLQSFAVPFAIAAIPLVALRIFVR